MYNYKKKTSNYMIVTLENKLESKLTNCFFKSLQYIRDLKVSEGMLKKIINTALSKTVQFKTSINIIISPGLR